MSRVCAYIGDTSRLTALALSQPVGPKRTAGEQSDANTRRTTVDAGICPGKGTGAAAAPAPDQIDEESNQRYGGPAGTGRYMNRPPA